MSSNTNILIFLRMNFYWVSILVAMKSGPSVPFNVYCFQIQDYLKLKMAQIYSTSYEWRMNVLEARCQFYGFL